MEDHQIRVISFFRGNEHINRCLDGQSEETLKQLFEIFTKGHEVKLDWYITGGMDNTIRCGRRNQNDAIADNQLIRIILSLNSARSIWRNPSQNVDWANADRKRSAFPLDDGDLQSVGYCIEYLANQHQLETDREGLWPYDYGKLDIDQEFEKNLRKSVADTQEARLQRIGEATDYPETKVIMTKVFIRNSDVVAQTLYLANGTCQSCQKPAPFKRHSDGRDYLEVHHKIPLAQHGKDKLENAIAICPNCHRDAHLGELPKKLYNER